MLTSQVATPSDVIAEVERSLVASSRLIRGERVVITAGYPPGLPFHTNVAYLQTG